MDAAMSTLCGVKLWLRSQSKKLGHSWVQALPCCKEVARVAISLLSFCSKFGEPWESGAFLSCLLASLS